MGDHAELGASSSHRWIACPGSINLSRQALPDKGSVYADAGIAAHEIMERCVTTGADPLMFLDMVIQTDEMGTPVTVDEDMVEAVRVVTDYVSSRVGAGAKLLGVEIRFDLAPLNPPGPMFGRADIVLRDPGTKPQRSVDHNGNIRVIMPKPGLLEVIDLKYGQGTVIEVENNPQLMIYALGAVVATDEIPGRLRSTVIQPRAPHPDGIIRSWEFDYSELKAFKIELFAAAVRTQDPDAELHIGPGCKFCPALAICPAQHQRAQDVAKAEFSAIVPLPDAVLAEAGDEQPTLPVPEALTLSELVEVMDAAPVYDAWIAAVRNHVRELTERGDKTGYKLVPKRGRRMWVDAAMTEKVLVNSMGDEAFAPRKLRSVTQAEKAAKIADTSIPPEMWEMVSTGTNLVPDDDPREALPPPRSAADDFEVVEVEFEDGTWETREVSAEGVRLQSPETEKADLLVAVVLEKAGSRMAKPEETLDPVEQEEAPEVIVNTWMVEAGGADVFFVEANSEAEAKTLAREVLGVTRLPNHTVLTPA